MEALNSRAQVPAFQEPGHYRVPRHHVPLGHSVEHEAGIVDAAAFSVCVDERGLDEDVGTGDGVGFHDEGVDLLGLSEGGEAGAGLEGKGEGEVVGEERGVGEEQAAEEGEGLGWLVGVDVGSDEGVVVRS